MSGISISWTTGTSAYVTYIYIYVLFKPTPTLRRTQRFKKGIETLLNKAKRSTHVSVPMFPASSACWAV